MTWTVGEIAEIWLGGSFLTVRLIHVSEEKIIVVPHMDLKNEVDRMTAKLAKEVFNADHEYMQKSFDPKTGKELSPTIGINWILKKKP